MSVSGEDQEKNQGERRKGQERAKASETRIFRRRWKQEMRAARGKVRRAGGWEGEKVERETT